MTASRFIGCCKFVLFDYFFLFCCCTYCEF